MGRHRTPDLPEPAAADVPPSPVQRPRDRPRAVRPLLSLALALTVGSAVLGSLELADSARASTGAGGPATATESLAAQHRPHRHAPGPAQRPQPPTATAASPATSAPVVAVPAPTSSSSAAPAPATTDVAASVPPGPAAQGAVPPADGPAPACTRYISTAGSDSAAGTAAAPWRTVLPSLGKVTPGTVLCVLPGTYTQEVVDSSLPDGTAAARVTLRSYDPDDRAVLDGRFSLSGLSFWTIRDLTFTNPTPTTTSGAPATDISDQRIVALIGGNDVLFQGNEVHDGLYAGLLVGRAGATAEIPQRYTIRGNYVHDTAAANLYFNTGRWSRGNVIERNIFANSGTENTKIGWGDDCRGVADDTDAYGAGEVEYRYNTLSNGGRAGSFVASEPGGVYEVHVDHNVFADPDSERGFVVRYDSATNSADFPTGCAGDKVYVTDNVGFGGTRFSQDFGDSPVSVSHEAGNVWPLDPQLDADFVPTNPAARGYGYAAP